MQLEVLTLPDNLLGSSIHVVYDPLSRDGLLVDAGCLDAEPIIRSIEGQGIRISHLLLTHEHFDHIWSADVLSRHFGVRCLAHKLCAAAAADPSQNLSRYTVHGACRATVGQPVGENFFQFSWNGHTVSMLHTPGHSPGSACFIIDNFLISGDTVLGNTTTITKLPGGNRLDFAASLLVLSAGIRFPITILPGHGMPWTALSLSNFSCCTGSKGPVIIG